MLQAEQRRRVREHNDRMHLAWHIAALGRMQKRFPKLEKLLVKPKKSGRARLPQTMLQQIAIARMWASLGYGKVKTMNDRKA